ncbi:alpha/beta hydrolase [Streptomyces sp. HPF1205]|uniref:alpha/beta hydrolase n=1 Tax=Streptomyces sp. HPF1205 TaxID=2873262 RepID=UPI001CEC696C|nr:alpha/beta fold hydrolase [Streptomyces sp. HPF1205]
MDSPAETGDERFRAPLITSGGRRAVLLTSDGVPIEAEHRPAQDDSGHLAIVVAHGFTGALDRPAIRAVARRMSGFGAVVTFSFRGHGRSGGRSTVGDREVLDLDAAVVWARSLGYTRVATLGFSMGGSVVLRHAGRTGPVAPRARTDAVVAVSSPARWYYRGTAPMRRLHWVVTRPAGRLVSRVGLRTRVHSREWDPVPLSPVESVPHIAPTPLLVVHGDRDGYFPLDHPLSLFDAADPATSDLWIERGFGHAENAADAALLSRIGEWLRRSTSQAPSPVTADPVRTEPPAGTGHDGRRHDET